jgi:signal transduction histidine kinase
VKEWWRRRNVRLSLTLWYCGATVVVLALYAGSVFTIVSRNASKTLDDRLRSDLQWAAEMVEQRPDGSLTWFEGDPGDGNSPWLQVWTQAGDLLYRSAFAERLPIPGSLSLRSHPDAGIRSLSTSARAMYRVLSARSKIGGSLVTIQVARSEAPMQQELGQLVLMLILGLPLGVAAAGFGGYSLARRALAPVDRMAERAHSITAERLSDRLPVDNPDDELGRLASVFNETLGRLEWSFDQMRRFTADVSHEVRTPLTAIRSVGEVGLRARRDEGAYRGIIGSMLEEADRLTGLVDRLLALSRAETGPAMMSVDVINLGELVDNVVAHLGVLAEEKDQSLAIECLGLPLALGDRCMLRQALINIVDNAIKFTPVGGGIRIRVLDSPSGAMLDVSDTGPGVPAELRARIFDRHLSGSQGGGLSSGKRCGTGLGLSIAKGAVEANGGRLTLESVNGAGSTFRITLPGLDAGAAANRQGAAMAALSA